SRSTSPSRRATEHSAEDARVPERVAPGLGPDAEAVRADADLDPGQQAAVDGADRVDDVVVPPRQPEHLAVDGDAAHVRAPAAGDAPERDDLPRAEVDHRDRSCDSVRDVEKARVAARIEAVGAEARAQKAEAVERRAVDLPEAAGDLVGDVEHLPVG